MYFFAEKIEKRTLTISFYATERSFTMDKNGNSLAIASVPCQKWKSTYDPQTSLKKGTVFPELNMPFFKADDSDEIPSGKGSADGKNPEQEEREALMAKIDEAGFVVNDLTLYLDTHKEDEEALRMFEEYANRKVMLMKEFAEKFYPLSLNCMVLCGIEMKTFSWTDGPAPWEGACI